MPLLRFILILLITPSLFAQTDTLTEVNLETTDTIVYDSARHFQVELAGFYSPSFGHFHVGVDLVACKPGWHNHFAITYNYSGEFDDGILLIGVGKKRVWEYSHLVYTAGLNTGIFRERYFHDVGLFLQPESFVGYRAGGLIVGLGGYVGGCAAWSGIKKTGESGYHLNPVKWFYYGLIYSPYVKVVFYL